ncbi:MULTISPECIES: hypothetical protein [unclassified Dolichospermum]|jgi:hypothetical protein|uniref:hypothetical protein n=1 Tax=unclassified Dolichospermum TaxID=2622029 RepID=UPI001445917A|nr:MULTISPECIES: hypothetical protein [unclassified Dolichospermum]MBO1054351.1 hypothetical protein [Dolichospermum sp. DET73]MTJ15957.1 hypothetical protein [Dolichospermum sp. UHCC 0299]MTJ37751.1 hypothetical protein [Dolichospermum sp. UHCC 0406]
MSINFFKSTCQSQTNQYKFGLCDDPNKDKDPAYIDTVDCSKWIAIVENNQEIEVIFTAIDNCIEILRSDGTMDNRCDGMLTYNNHLIFVELKEKNYRNNWVVNGEKQLKNTINVFIANHDLAIYKSKKAYIANNKKPNFQSSQMGRMARFEAETDFRLIIRNTIEIS